MLFFELLFICVVLASKSGASGNKFFRFDYTHDEAVEGWFKYNPVPATWSSARLRCILEGATLASPTTNKIWAAMMNLMKGRDACGIFTGVHALYSKGDYFSFEGVPLLRMPVEFTAGEPDNEDNTEDCILLLRNGTIADVKCTDAFPYICYKEKSEHMFMTNCGTIDKEYTFDSRTGNCYKFHHVGRNWQQAFMTCAAEGSYLAIINSNYEATLLAKLFEKNFATISKNANKLVVLVGFSDFDKQGNFITIHGQTLQEAGYEMWGQGQPDNAKPGEPCGAMFKNGLLDDIWCDNIAPFICEKSPESLQP